MPTFSNVNNTSSIPVAGFAYADYEAQVGAAVAGLGQTLQTVAVLYPSYSSVTATSAALRWSDGTRLDASITASSAMSVTLSSVSLTGSNGSWMELAGSAKVSMDGGGYLTAAAAKLTRIAFGDDQAMQIANGSAKLDINLGSLTGKLKTLTLAWAADNPATVAREWSYLTLSGNVSATGSLNAGLQTLAGKITGVEWGVIAESPAGALTTQAAGSVTGLKIDGATLLQGLDASGFAALNAGLYGGNDTVTGTEGGDTLDAGAGNDKVYGQGGNDTISGGAGNDQLFGGAGHDLIDGGAGNDKILDDSGNNTISDTAGNANITTGSGSDAITTGSGNDKIIAGDGSNTIASGAGNDNIVTGSGADQISAGDGNDKVTAGNGNNLVMGGAGNDTIVSGSGSDRLNGGTGADKLTGGAGADVFVFDNLAIGGKDTIMDFNAAEDVIAFDVDVFTALAGGVVAENFVIGKAALEADDHLVLDTMGGKLYYDADGNGAQTAVQIAVVKGSLAGLSADNFTDVALLA